MIKDMDPLFRRYLFILLIVCPYIIILGAVITSGGDWSSLPVRLCGLAGFISLCLGAILTFIRTNIRSLTGQPFLRIHHLLVLAGLVAITIHPLLIALRFQSAAVFIPDLSSLLSFLAQGGRVAIILIYIGFLAAIFRSALHGRWQMIHRLMYPAIILGVIHANLLGQDFLNPAVRWLCNLLAFLVIMTGVAGVVRRHRSGKR